ncbi:hypothetical protein BDW_08470 [Bdellovibrio bacteriovorus W]|nr:hypothetical protein BDW_08470 [Bdellovibrio bacteriovorus W]
MAKNPSYSLRSFAQYLGVNHATLSALISGKRKMTEATFQKLSAGPKLRPADNFKKAESECGHFRSTKIRDGAWRNREVPM